MRGKRLFFPLKYLRVFPPCIIQRGGLRFSAASSHQKSSSRKHPRPSRRPRPRCSFVFEKKGKETNRFVVAVGTTTKFERYRSSWRGKRRQSRALSAMKNDDENGLEAAAFETIFETEEDKEEEDDDFQTKTIKAFHLVAVPNLESESRTNYKGKAGKKIGS